ncbi:hypothetical protein VCR12J2_620662 [Vibrio coralliirubri]|uniref:hypothetical protein n=1 Tax=Vibrio coralliirubri TaxID=1516159 RepID=UPI000635B188|nr:hypothetical protein [Vibrio coralliirubri]CDU01913.1 hypothetical protein VCR12J2_620662 [Vibrio coralliirubri]
MFERIEDLTFVNWKDFGVIIEESANDTAFTTIKDYTQTIGFILGTRATRASQ